MNKKKITALLLSVAMLVNFTPKLVNASPLDESKAQFNEISSDIKNLDDEISKLDNEIYEIKQKISANESQVEQIENEIENTNYKIETLKKEIEENKKVLSLRLREMYKNGTSSSLNWLEFILESDGLNDFFSRIYSVKTIVKMDNKLIDDNNKMVSTLDDSVVVLNEKKESVDKLNDEIKVELNSVQEKQNSVSESRAKLSSKRDSIANLIKENEEALVSGAISVVNSGNASASELQEALRVLKGMLPQISTDSVKSKVNSAISSAQGQIDKLNAPPAPSTPSNGDYKATYTMEATAYYGHGVTAVGTVPVRDPNGISTVAVDKNVIPLGTMLYIPNYGYAVAADTGGVIKGMKIDLYMNSYEECYNFGRRNITVHVLK